MIEGSSLAVKGIYCSKQVKLQQVFRCNVHYYNYTGYS